MSAVDNQLFAAETLLRFHSEKMGMVSPVEFIPILEETGLIIPVGKWVLHQALSVCREVHKYVPDFKISVNVSYKMCIRDRPHTLHTYFAIIFFLNFLFIILFCLL